MPGSIQASSGPDHRMTGNTFLHSVEVSHSDTLPAPGASLRAPLRTRRRQRCCAHAHAPRGHTGARRQGDAAGPYTPVTSRPPPPCPDQPKNHPPFPLLDVCHCGAVASTTPSTEMRREGSYELPSPGRQLAADRVYLLPS